MQISAWEARLLPKASEMGRRPLVAGPQFTRDVGSGMIRWLPHIVSLEYVDSCDEAFFPSRDVVMAFVSCVMSKLGWLRVKMLGTISVRMNARCYQAGTDPRRLITRYMAADSPFVSRYIAKMMALTLELKVCGLGNTPFCRGLHLTKGAMPVDLATEARCLFALIEHTLSWTVAFHHLRLVSYQAILQTHLASNPYETTGSPV